ncbi:hypothetical protein H1D32_10095 [Anaerobacillus sp. CMMVII]|uniref:hypothetical protein n=1 Tax=Anaerobacillus sp. CMMVII TaxID=2755588 RepID=UPI0021B79243|nr:hypothetical protein [Anaerobacillus sp. CMMVII]MCT8138076.1 hypothetical protein [Anaerobacillus sp. CMMVII]
MFTDLNKDLEEIKERQWKKRKYEEHLTRAKNYLQEEKRKAETLKSQLMKEKKDVDKLERVSLSNIFYTIIGKKLEKLDKEQQEVLAAELKYEEALETMKEVEEEIAVLSSQLESVRHADRDYQLLLIEKEKLIHDEASIWSDQLYELSDKQADLKASLKEYQEAIVAGNSTSLALSTALTSLDKARNWSTWDMIGGGMISTAIKHGHIDDAKNYVHQAQTRLRLFQEELKDVINHDHIDLQFSGMLTFADYFFDGLIVDWVVHGKITDSIKQVESTKATVDRLLRQLLEQQNKREIELKQIEIERKQILETAK